MGTEYKLVAVGGGEGTVPLDTDTTLAADSDKRVASQKAVKGFLAAKFDEVMAAGSGFAGTGTVYKSSVVREGDLIKTTLFIDLTGTKSSTTDLDIIGTHATNPSHVGQVTAAKNGGIIGGKITCLEAPAGGVNDIDLYSATEGTGAFDGGIGALAETALVTSGGAWTSGASKGFLANPAANSHLYLCGGAAGTAATYTAGQFMIEMWGV